jgi:polyisoprenyl-teichoic acid--peptidoglycan teichoic acid transferase
LQDFYRFPQIQAIEYSQRRKYKLNRRDKRNRREKKNRKSNKAMLAVLALILCIVVIPVSYVYYQLGRVKTTPIPKGDEDLGIVRDEMKGRNSEVVNIALFGIDRRNESETGRSDSIMILTVDKRHKKIKLSSIMRDTYVNVKDYGKTKINHAYAYGGPQLAIRTINENFKMDITDFVMVDFEGLKGIIDTIGGVSIEVKDYELPGMRKVGIETPGRHNLSGDQALAYSRIRYQGNGDFERTDRQRTVMMEILNKVNSQGKSKFPGTVSKMLPFVETSFSTIDIMSLGTSIFTSGINKMDEQRFPVDGYGRGQLIGGIYYLVIDQEETTNQLHRYIYEDEKPKPKR